MKKLAAAALAAALMTAAVPAFAVDDVVSVTFASVVATPAKDGSTLDAKLFSFGPNKTGQEDDHSRVSGSAHGRSKEDACRWALLSSFLKFQHKAQSMGKRVVAVRTNIGDEKSAKADKCLCLVGAWAVKSQILAVYK